MATDWQPLKGKIALVTGGSRGIGAGISRKLASWGCGLGIVYVDRHGPAQKIAKELREKGTEVNLFCRDLSQADEIATLMEEVAARYSDLHILVHNAGAAKFSELEKATLEHWQFVQDTNSRSTWLLAKHALPLMKNRPGARYITITNSSPVSIVPRAGLFAVAKAGMQALTQYLSYELAPYGIVVNCIRPGLVQTAVFDVRPEFSERVKHELSISPWKNGSMTTPENTADAVAMLCLDEASWIAGQVITVDGGFCLWGNLDRDQREGEGV